MREIVRRESVPGKLLCRARKVVDGKKFGFLACTAQAGISCRDGCPAQLSCLVRIRRAVRHKNLQVNERDLNASIFPGPLGVSQRTAEYTRSQVTKTEFKQRGVTGRTEEIKGRGRDDEISCHGIN